MCLNWLENSWIWVSRKFLMIFCVKRQSVSALVTNNYPSVLENWNLKFTFPYFNNSSWWSLEPGRSGCSNIFIYRFYLHVKWDSSAAKILMDRNHLNEGSKHEVKIFEWVHYKKLTPKNSEFWLFFESHTIQRIIATSGN